MSNSTVYILYSTLFLILRKHLVQGQLLDITTLPRSNGKSSTGRTTHYSEPGRAAIQSIPELHPLPHPIPISESQIPHCYQTIAEHEPRNLQAAAF